MKFKEALDLVQGIHDQNGDTSFEQWALQHKKSLEEHKSYSEWVNNMNRRTDVSQDDKWEIEEFSESFRVLFVLMESRPIPGKKDNK